MPKDCLGLQNGGGGGGGGGGAYIGHPMCETTRKPNILAKTRDKEVIHQNRGRFGINYTKMTGAGDFAMQGKFR